jgi:TRAP-type C4-dicarboxylate transport system substrate-binding protein
MNVQRGKNPRALTTALIAILAASAALLTTGAPAAAHADEGPVNLKIATIAPPSTPWATVMTRIKKAFSKDFPKEQLKVKTYLGGALGGEKDLVSRCLSGGLGMIGVTSGAMATVVPELNVLELPYLWTDEKQVDKALAGPLGDALKAAMEKKGFVLFAWSENGFRHFATRDRFIHQVKDLRGLRMRAQPSYVHTSMYKAFGAAANPMPAPEVPGALSSGVVDGYDNSLLYAFATQWYNNIKFLTVSSHIYQPAVIVYCKKVFDKLPADMQAKMATHTPKIEAAGRALVRSGNRAALKSHEAAGIKVETQKNREAFKSAAKSVWDEFVKNTPDGKKLLDLAIAATR